MMVVVVRSYSRPVALAPARRRRAGRTGSLVTWVLIGLLLGAVLPGGVGRASVPLDPSVPSPAALSGLTAGNRHTCGLTGAGTAYCWGYDANGELGNGAVSGAQVSPSAVDVSGLGSATTFTQLSAGGAHTCGLTGAGVAYCWGYDANGELGNGAGGDSVSPSAVDVTGLGSDTTFTQLSAGDGHTCGLTGAGVAYCWGDDSDGQLGNGAGSGNAESPSAVDISGLGLVTTFTQLSASDLHTCGLTGAGVAYCWGADSIGQLGNGASGNAVSPSAVDVSGLGLVKTFTQLSAGGAHTCGVTGAGVAYCWGWDNVGQLGNGAGGYAVSPSAVDVNGLGLVTTFTQLSAGDLHTCGVTGAGTAYCWGADGTGGRLGNGTVSGDQASPSAVEVSGLPAGTTFTQLSAGGPYSCGLSGAGAAYCWGSDVNGQLGNGAISGGQVSPSAVDVGGLPPGTTFTQLSAGNAHTCGLTGAGTAYCWGAAGNGRLGNGAVSGGQVPPSAVDVSGLPAGTTFTQLSAGNDHTCGLTGAGTAYCWGNDFSGQLGNGAVSGNQASPSTVDVSGLGSDTTFTQLSAGDARTCGVTGAGTAYCWGADFEGQLGNGAATENQLSPSAVNVSALPSGTTFRQLSAGRLHTCGLTGAGAAYCWGNDGFGQLGGAGGNMQSPSPVDVSGVPAPFTHLSAGTDHTCGLTGAGTAYCWGYDGFGQLGNGAVIGGSVSPSAVSVSGLPAGTTFAQLSAGSAHTCGLTGAGTAYCWGSNGDGQLGIGATGGGSVSPSAVSVSGLSGVTTFTQLSAGAAHTCGLTGASTAYCWGRDIFGELGNGAASGDDQASPSAVDVDVSVTVDDQAAAPGDDVTLTAVTAGVGPASLQWYRDGAPVSGETGQTYTFAATLGDRSVVFSAALTNVFIRSDTDTAAVAVNTPPVANTGGPYSVGFSQPVPLDAGASSDADGDALTYAWDLGGDASRFDDPTSATPIFDSAGLVAGDHTVTLTVSDGTAGDTDTATVTVRPRPFTSRPVVVSTGETPSEESPLQVTVTSPNGGPVLLDVRETSTQAPEGYTLHPLEVEIDAPDATVGDPLVIELDIHESLLDGAEVGDLVVFHNGVAVRPCEDQGAGVASPDPCVEPAVSPGTIRVLSSQAGTFSLGIAAAPGLCDGVEPAEYSDVAASHVHAASIDCVTHLGIAEGIGDTRFAPGADMTRGQMATFLVNALATAGLDLPAASDQGFTDISASMHGPNINRIVAAGLANGTTATTFGPGEPMRRGQMATFLINAYQAIGGETAEPVSDAFSDDDGHIHEGSIDTAAALGLTSGTTATTFEPDANVRRGQMTTFIVNLLTTALR